MFNSTQAASIEDAKRQPKVLMSVDGKELTDNFHMLSMTSEGSSNIQIDRSFNGSTFVTAFGENVTPLSFTGVSLPGDVGCAGDESVPLIQIYLKYRAGKAADTVPLLSFAYDGAVFEGVLKSIRQTPYTLTGKAEMDIFQYSLSVLGKFKPADDSAGSATGHGMGILGAPWVSGGSSGMSPAYVALMQRALSNYIDRHPARTIKTNPSTSQIRAY